MTAGRYKPGILILIQTGHMVNKIQVRLEGWKLKAGSSSLQRTYEVVIGIEVVLKLRNG